MHLSLCRQVPRKQQNSCQRAPRPVCEYNIRRFLNIHITAGPPAHSLVTVVRKTIFRT